MTINHSKAAQDLSLDLPESRGYSVDKVSAAYIAYMSEAERASSEKLLSLIERLSPSKYVLNALDIVRVIVAHEVLSTR